VRAGTTVAAGAAPAVADAVPAPLVAAEAVPRDQG